MPDVAATIAAARACASTILFHSLRLQAFRGAVPHVMLVMDQHPCVQQKVLLEGYVQVLEEFNGNAAASATMRAASSEGKLIVPLDPAVTTPCGSEGLIQARSKISYSVVPFIAESFLGDMHKLQAFLRHCGDVPAAEGLASEPRWSTEMFTERYAEVSHYFRPIVHSSVDDPAFGANVPSPAELQRGPARELLSFILMERNAFQNEMRRYRLRLTLFDMGARVAEHCHLESMSTAADALAKSGAYTAALEDDEVYSFARACSFPPAIAETLGKAIADSVDLQSWQRGGGVCDDNNDDGDGQQAAKGRAPPAAYEAALRDAEVWKLFNSGALRWGGEDAPGAASVPTVTYEAAMQTAVTGAGAPLRVVCRDRSKVLTYSGGMEDCLMNTGSYAAAEADARNDVVAHRARFALAQPEKEEPEASGGEQPGGTADLEAAAPPVHGRMKKQEYLAMLKQQGKRPETRKRRTQKGAMDSDADEEDGASRPQGSSMTSSIGGTFPIGEVISESFDLSKLSGTCAVFAYPDPYKRVAVCKPAPFTLTIVEGVVVDVSDNAPEDFVDLLSLVRQSEGSCYVRELGIGLNPFVGLSHPLTDVTSFERQWGIHLSLGQRHPLFVKQKNKRNANGSIAEAVTVKGPVLKRKAGKYHIDVFVDAAELSIGQLTVDFTKGIAA